MGDVYQTTDTKLDRSVAIQFLPEAFSHDTERVARFQREARVLALNHPNIAAIYGVEETNSRTIFRICVMLSSVAKAPFTACSLDQQGKVDRRPLRRSPPASASAKHSVHPVFREVSTPFLRMPRRFGPWANAFENTEAPASASAISAAFLRNFRRFQTGWSTNLCFTVALQVY
jgi:serine/threonine protein kinase